MYQSYYIYQHVDPETNEIVYVGQGKKHRAWVMGTMRNHKINNLQYGHRNRDHNNWMEGLIDKGYLPCDWVKIYSKQQSKEDSSINEINLIKQLNPKYNINHTDNYRNPPLIDIAKGWRYLGLSFSDIGKMMKVSTMKAWRLCNVYKK